MKFLAFFDLICHNAEDDYRYRWWITLAILLVAVIEVLDMTIVNVALPDMMGSLGANVSEITWVLTSYVVSAAVVMPLTGVLVRRFGRRQLLLINIVGFLLSSMLCGFAFSLASMIFFRALQGIFGASLVPISQFVLRDVFPKKEQGAAMAVWGMGIMCAPVLGPTIGGYITANLTWRWVFYINLPICVVAFFLTLMLVRETSTHKDHIDWLGLILMVVGVGCLQVFLDRGESVNWFEASSTWWLTGIFTSALGAFVIRCKKVSQPIINLSLFQDRNFAIAASLMLLFVMMVMGQMTLSALMLQTVFNYPAEAAGLMMGPRGLGSMFTMAVVGRLSNRLDPRIFLLSGMVLAVLATFLLSHLSLELSVPAFATIIFIQGMGMGLFFVPLATLSLSTLPSKYIAEGSGLFSFSRSLGLSMGISVMATLLSRGNQMNWNTLGGYITPYSANLTLWLQATHWHLSDPKTVAHLANVLQLQANMIAFNNTAWFATVCLLLITPLIFLLKKPQYSVETSSLH
jgi:MFS transporter, DHA2 family, multidrug resistance protein